MGSSRVEKRLTRGRTSWFRAVEQYVETRRTSAVVGASWLRRMRWELRRTPDLLRRAGITQPPVQPRRFRDEHLLAMKQHLPWGRATLRLHFAALRPFLRWAGNRITDSSSVWKVPSGDAGRRRWITRIQLIRLVHAARGRERLLITLEGLNGLRRIEVLRLRFQDIHLAEGFLDVCGKGRDGGKWRQVPICPSLGRLLAGLTPAGSPDSRLVPLSLSGADALLRRAAARAGFLREGVRVSHHDLRRTFGRLSHQAGMDLVQLKNLYGHSSLDQTVHYIGLDQAEMRRGLDRLESFLHSGRSRQPLGPSRFAGRGG